mmetsp:Transcript_9824/g.26781  ORF Transcript_9824/g.26781 Transcript_9824/m.26781 type:complete len:206 (-) Transcript_9824:1208-1825(-)|eukprot:CAMPEP_0198109460 /NCGR_PEP_ID=MMETSP1442-20131203/1496_1 /TAXON_ID= /ORGANISM="Craspedostauros australis, Strain CCMP3328" /LENGTH=205 /DNA_ID=CAMNT_0043765129 /DNA_START=105 /DNA_END=722 /DNA_ORIENTATION=-
MARKGKHAVTTIRRNPTRRARASSNRESVPRPFASSSPAARGDDVGGDVAASAARDIDGNNPEAHEASDEHASPEADTSGDTDDNTTNNKNNADDDEHDDDRKNNKEEALAAAETTDDPPTVIDEMQDQLQLLATDFQQLSGKEAELLSTLRRLQTDEQCLVTALREAEQQAVPPKRTGDAVKQAAARLEAALMGGDDDDGDDDD